MVTKEELQHYLDDGETMDLLGDFLEHHGVKGMKWGVHHQRALELHTRVAEGRGSKLDKAKAFSEMSAIDLAKHKGNVTAYSKERAHNLQAMKDRVNSGNGTAADRVNLLLAKTAGDVVRGARGKGPKEKEPGHRYNG